MLDEDQGGMWTKYGGRPLFKYNFLNTRMEHLAIVDVGPAVVS